MAFEPPRSLSPSRVSSFTDCALAFRFAAIDRLPEPPSAPAVKGTLVHAALERLLWLPPNRRDLAAALDALAAAIDAIQEDPEFIGLELDEDAALAFFDDAEQKVRAYLSLEDPATVRPIGVELTLQAELGDLVLRGIIDRLELDADGELVVTDYKTGPAPDVRYERSRLGGVHFYAYLCERQLGRRPARVQLLHLGGPEPEAVVTVPTDQSIRAVERKIGAVWSAIERSCASEDFRPKPSRRCDWCAFRAFCPAFGGDPDEARRLSERLRADTSDPTAAVA